MLKQEFYTYFERHGVLTPEKPFILLTTDVVPSPTSLSCRSASSHKTLAAGCSTSSSFRMVAPSLVMVTSYKMRVSYLLTCLQTHTQTDVDVILTPMSSTNILSRPTGPRELLTMFAIDAAAMTAQIIKMQQCDQTTLLSYRRGYV